MKTFATSGLRAYSVDQMRLLETVIFTSSGTFDPADYSYGGALRVWVQGGGGGGGGFDTGIKRGGGGGGGGGCAYQEMIKGSSGHWNEPNTVTVGLGGAGSTGKNVYASAGGNSSFIRATSGGGPTGYGGSGGGGFYEYHSWQHQGGGGTGHSGVVYSGGRGGTSRTDDTMPNCSSRTTHGAGGSGGINWTPAAKYLAANPILYFREGLIWAGSNSGSSSANMTARTTNTGGGGSSVGVSCTSSLPGYGQGGDSGIVIVEVWG